MDYRSTVVLIPTRLEASRVWGIESEVTGIGADASIAALMPIVDELAPATIVSAGFAGALDPNLSVGEIIRPTWVTNAAGNEIKLESGDGRTLLSLDRVASPEEKRELRNRSCAAAVDMETFALAHRCRELGIRFVSIRCISDTFTCPLPAASADWVSATGVPRVGRVLVWSGLRPSRLRLLLQLRKNAKVAAERLGGAIQSLRTVPNAIP